VFVCVVAYYRTLMCKKQESRVYSLPCSATPWLQYSILF